MKKFLAVCCFSLSIATSATAGDLGTLLTGLGAQLISNVAAKAMGVAPTAEPSRQMNAESWQNARAAEAVFQSLPAQADDGAIYDPKNAPEARRLIAAYRKASAPIRAGPNFTQAQLAAYAQSLQPFLRYAQSGLPQSDTTILPGQKKTFQAQTFCLDRGLPAPIPQDNLRLIPSGALIPEKDKALYDALMRASTSHPNARFTVQNLAWGLRHAQQGYKPALDKETQALLNEALPDGTEQYQSFLQDRQRELQQSQQRQQLFRQLQGLVAESTGIQLPPPSTTDGSFTAGDVAQALVALNHAPAPPPDSVAQGSPYTQLAPNVAAKVSNAVAASAMQIEVVNAGDQPFSFVATDYVGQTVRPTQRMAIASINDASPDAQYDWNWTSPAQLAEKKLQAVTAALEIPALKQAQRNIQTWLDRQAEAGASKPMLGALALGTAVNEVLLPTTAVDLLPLGKIGKLTKAAGEVERAVASEKALAASAELADDAARNAKPGSAGFDRTGKNFTPRTKAEIDSENADKYGGINKCEYCNIEVEPGRKSQRGVTPPPNERQRDHIIPKSQGGDGTLANGQILCRECNLNKSDN